MIRFSAFLVVVAVGLLIAGVVTSKLLFVYIAIGVSGVALLALGVGAAINWRELTGKPGTAQPEMAAPTPAQSATARPEMAQPAPAQSATAQPVTAQPASAQPASAVTSAPGPASVPPEPVPAVPAPAAGVPAPAAGVPAPAAGAAPAGAGWPVTATSIPSGPSRAGYLPAAEPPPRARPAPAPGPALPGGPPESRPGSQPPA